MSAEAFEVEGGFKLKGELIPQGAKNEALQIICVPLLTAEKVTIHNIPDILDIRLQLDLLEGLGVKLKKLSSGSIEFDSSEMDIKFFESEDYLIKAKRIRGSVMLMGALLSRFGKAFLPKPGCDKIGRRRLDTHFLGFEKLGANLVFDEKKDHYYLDGTNLKGTFILMDEISVTGTANIVFAALKAQGTTTIYNAACEPYLQQLCKMLNRMGAKISGVGSNMLTIEGVSSLKGTEHTCLPDMIEIGSFIGLAAMTKSYITIKNCRIDMLGVIPKYFQKLGIKLEFNNDDIIVHGQERYEVQNFIDGSILTISDGPWPMFTPDLLSIVLVTAIQAEGSVLIHQKMF